jgi:hypothetical protein
LEKQISSAHDLEGHLDVYWKSRQLLVVVGSEQFNGWLLKAPKPDMV